MCGFKNELRRADWNADRHFLSAGIDSACDTLATAIQVNLSMVEDSEDPQRRATWATAPAVSPALVGIRGMHFKYEPALNWRFGDLLALGVVVSSAALMHGCVKRLGWL